MTQKRRREMEIVGSNPKLNDRKDIDEAKEPENVFDRVDHDSKIDPPKEDPPVDPAQAVVSNNAKDINKSLFSDDELVITPSEKAEFIDAMVDGRRYTEEVELLGGRIHVTLRSRTVRETQAMYAFMRHELASGYEAKTSLESDMQYLLTAACVQELNGVTYPELKEPLTYTASGKEEIPPGWLPDMEAWKSKPEGLLSAIANRIQLFEYKYWTMVNEANNKNFWNPDTSTEK